jgi:hypothetical protein
LRILMSAHLHANVCRDLLAHAVKYVKIFRKLNIFSALN